MPTENPRSSARETGFTLVEVLVALVITSALLAVLFDGMIGARQRATAADREIAAIRLADNLLREHTIMPYAGATTTGHHRALSWTLKERTLSADPTRRWLLAELEVSVTDGSGRALFSAARRKIKRAPE